MLRWKTAIVTTVLPLHPCPDFRSSSSSSSSSTTSSSEKYKSVCAFTFSLLAIHWGKSEEEPLRKSGRRWPQLAGNTTLFSPLISLQPGQTTDGNMFCQCSSGAFNPCQPRLTHSLRPRPPLWLLQLLLSGSCRSSSSADCQFDCHRIAIAPKEQSISVKSLYIFSFFFLCVSCSYPLRFLWALAFMLPLRF